MPETKFQSIIFTAIMVFFMVFSMTVYTISLNAGSLQYSIFWLAIREMWIEYAVVFCLIFFFIRHAAKKLALRIITKRESPIFMMLAMQAITVCMIVPSITLIATFIHNGFTANWFTSWIQTAFLCFPTALCLQIFFIGPFVRFIFRVILHILHTQFNFQNNRQ